MPEQGVATKRSQRPPRWSPWAPARIDALKAHWSKGLNARAIARELKQGVTRAAVLGKIRRLGIADLAPAVVEPRTVQRAARKAKRPRTESARRVVPSAVPRRLASTPITLWRTRSVPSWVFEAQPYVDALGLDSDIPRLQRRTFAQLNRAACRWSAIRAIPISSFAARRALPASRSVPRIACAPIAMNSKERGNEAAAIRGHSGEIVAKRKAPARCEPPTR